MLACQPKSGIGHFFGAMRVDAFRPAAEFKQHMDNWITTFRNAKTKASQESVLVPGDPERIMEQKRYTEGIPLLDPVVKDLESLGHRFNLSL